jgi:hypothetical protein
MRSPNCDQAFCRQGAHSATQVIAMLIGMEAKCTTPSDLEAGLAFLGHPAPVAEVAGCLAALHATLEFKQRRAR